MTVLLQALFSCICAHVPACVCVLSCEWGAGWLSEGGQVRFLEDHERVLLCMRICNIL